MFLIDAFEKGGWGMYPIAILAVITILIAVDRFMYVSKAQVDVDRLMGILKSQIVSGNIQGALNTCLAQPKPATRIIAAGLRKAGSSEHDVQQAMDEEALRELPDWKSAPVTWPCWVTWPRWPASLAPSPASSKRSPASPASIPRRRRPCFRRASPKQ